MARLSPQGASGAAATAESSLHSDIARDALQAVRQAVLSMRDSDEIGDDAFHRIEAELDWVEMAATNAM